MRNSSFRAAAVAALACAHWGAQAALLVFDNLPLVQHQYELGGLSDVRTDIYDKGFRLVYTPAEGEQYPTGIFWVGPKWRFNGKSVAATINSCLGSLTITREDNNPFGIDGIDLATLNGDPSASVTFVGVTPDGQTVTETAQVGPAMQWSRHRFPSTFSRLQSLTWRQGDCFVNMPHMFDNVELTR